MDTLNSLGSAHNSLANPRQFSDETRIYRQHEDRFVRPETFDRDAGGQVVRNVSRLSEGISFNQDKGLDSPITTYDNLNWYLIYRSEGEAAIRAYLVADEEISVKWINQGDSADFNATNMADGVTYSIDLTEQPTEVEIITPTRTLTVLSQASYYIGTLSIGTLTPTYRYCTIDRIEFKKVGGDLTFKLIPNSNISASVNSPSASNDYSAYIN